MSAVDNAYRDTAQNGIDLVLGLGASGYSCVKFLSLQGREVRVADSRLQPPFALHLQDTLPDTDVSFGGFDDSLLEQVSRIVVSPGIPSSEPILQEAKLRNLPAVSDIELFANVAPAPIIGITGSNGKSTVTTWIAHVLTTAGYTCCTGGNLGVPALDLLDSEIPDYYILELSSFQLERTENLHLRVGAMLNVGTDHVDHHGSIENYRQAKWKMFKHCETAVLFSSLIDSSEYTEYLDRDRTKTVMYGPDSDYHLEVASASERLDSSSQPQTETWLCHKYERLLPVSVLKVVGLHNYFNALAVIAIAAQCGLNWSETYEGLTSFDGLPHRMQWIGESHGVTWINDSKGTNVDATVAALESLLSPVVLIAGGEAKGADFSQLAAAISTAKHPVRGAVLIGVDAQVIEQALSGSCTVLRATSMSDAVAQATTLAQSGDVVLLSPACASFDMFDSYQHRGDEFVQAWRNLS